MSDTDPRTVLASSTLRALRSVDTAHPADETPTEETPTEETPTEETPTEKTPTDETGDTGDTPPPSTRPRRTTARPSRAGTSAAAVAHPRRRNPAVVVTSILAVLALAFAVVAGVLWLRAAHSSDRSVAAARDTAALDARLDIQAVNTSNYQHPQTALDKWVSVSTGPLRAQFVQARAGAITALGQAKIVTTAQVLDLAVTALDVRTGKATAIASVDVRKQPVTGAAAIARNRFRASLVRVGGQWLLSDLTIVSVSLT